MEKIETSSKRISKYIYSHRLEKDDISDIALEIVDSMIIEGLIPDCTDTENQKESEVQDIIREHLNELFNIKE